MNGNDSVDLGIQSADLEVQGLINIGLNYLYANPQVIDEIFKPLTKPHLASLYGQKEIDKIRKWVQEKKIRVVQAWSVSPEMVPCYSVELAGEEEDSSRASLGDYAGTGVDIISPSLIVASFIPYLYVRNADQTTTITVPPGVNTDPIFPGQNLLDAAGNTWAIQGPITNTKLNGASTITFDINDDGMSELAECSVVSSFTTQTSTLGATGSYQTVRIGVHTSTTGTNTVMWMSTILKWIGLRFKPEFELRGLDLTGFSITGTELDASRAPEELFTRYYTTRFRTVSAWTQDKIPNFDSYTLDMAASPLDSNTSVQLP